MKVSSKGDYGLRALVDMTMHATIGQPVQVKDIARRQHMPEEYLGQLMVTLRRAGLVTSVRGASGGYLLARAPETITVADVLEILEGPLAIVDGLLKKPDRGAAGPGQALREVWWDATQAALQVLRGTTLRDLADREAMQAYTYHI